MQQVGLWRITETGPQKATAASVDLEKQLEDWIEQDPALLETGLVILGRQFPTEAGPIDLLALDHQGRWTVIEMKKGPVRRETIAQALDYASCISGMAYDQIASSANQYLSGENSGKTLVSVLASRMNVADAQSVPRDVRMLVVGTGRDPGLDRLVNYLSGFHELPIDVVSYQVFDVGDRQRILVRELTEPEPVSVTPIPPPQSIGALVERADRVGRGPQFRNLLALADRHGLAPRVYKHCVTFPPHSNRTRTLFTVWPDWGGPGPLVVWVGTDIFPQFYPVVEEEALRELGPVGYRKMMPEDVDTFIAAIDRLFEQIKKGA